MRDKVIRKAFHQTVLKSAHNDIDTVVVDELGLKNGEIRADIAVLNGKLIGYEIKAEKDNLNRLASQVVAYSEVFEKAFLIVSDNHFDKAIESIPTWWGVYRIKLNKQNEYVFTCYRKAKVNRQRNPFSIACLLWKDEVSNLASHVLQLQVKSGTTKHKMYETISAICTPEVLSKWVLSYLKQRNNWRTDPQLPL